MTPQKKKAVLFLILMLAISACIIIWNFFINRGTLVLTGDVPFTVNIGNIKNRICEISPCNLTLKPKKYVLQAKKQGYFDLEENVSVKLLSATEFDLQFKLIPVVEVIGKYELPSKFSRWETNALNFGPSFDWSKTDLSKIPNGAKKVIFSQSGQKALVFIGKETYLFNSTDLKKAYLAPISLPDFETFTFTNNELLLLLINEDEKQKLILIDPEKTETKTVIVSFESSLQNPNIQIAGDEILILNQVQDQTNSLNGVKAYEISLSQKSKHRLDLPQSTKQIKLLNKDLLAYEALNSVYLKSLKDSAETKINTVSINHILNTRENSLLIVSETANGKSSVTPTVSIEELVDMATQNIESLQAEAKKGMPLKWYFSELNIENGLSKISAQDMAEVTHSEDETIDLFPLQQDQNTIWFTTSNKAGKTLKALRLAK